MHLAARSAPRVVRYRENVAVIEHLVRTDLAPKHQAVAIHALAVVIPTDALRVLEEVRLHDIWIEPRLGHTEMVAAGALPAGLVGVAVGAMVAAVGGFAALDVTPCLAALGAYWASAAVIPRRPMIQLLARLRGIPMPEPGKEDRDGAVFTAARLVKVGWPTMAARKRGPAVFVHELMHVIDFACGGARPLSRSPRFLKIYGSICNGGPLSWPTFYSVTSSAELLAEAACAYLGVGPWSSTKLKRVNPELWKFVDDVFVDIVPRALREGRILRSKHWQRFNVATPHLPPPKSLAWLVRLGGR